ncbi:unnamed protein product [Adineta steineri]|uniref:LicD/FKTN/FKRP nucleotidyltransferase domain-containing protein n=1 Tax=Adineta steineri TaxID=433720 RepID=A0A814VMI5_9BILA|nr:unnamed protein product [Adineta steineri]
MIGGSLVGSVRHWDIIPWDRDFDFFVPKNHKELLERQFPIEQHEMSLYMRPGNLKHGPTKIFPESKSKVIPSTRRYPFIDIFYYDENKTHIWDHKQCCHHNISKSVVFPLSIRPLGSLWLPAPRNPFDYFQELHPPLFSHVESECHVRGYAANIMKVMFKPPMIVQCKTLSRMYPFVERRKNNIERLILDGEVLQTMST